MTADIRKWLGCLGMALAVLLGILSTARDSHAQETADGSLRIAVLSVQTDDAYDQADALTAAMRYAVRNSVGYSLYPGDHSLEVLSLSLKCESPPDGRCQTQIADQIKVDRYIWGILHKDGDNVRGTLNLWIRGKGTTTTQLNYTSNLTEAADEALRGIALKATDELTGGPPKGTVELSVGRVSGLVLVDGEVTAQLADGRATLELTSGEHEIRIQADGYEVLETSVEVSPNGKKQLTLQPIVEGDDNSVDARKIGGFVGVGLGLSFGVVGLISTLQVASDNSDPRWEAFRQQYPNSPDVCASAEQNDLATQTQDGALTREEAQSICNRAGTFELMQAVFYPLAAISGGLGLYLLGSADWGDAEGADRGSIQVLPNVGATGADMTVRVQF